MALSLGPFRRLEMGDLCVPTCVVFRSCKYLKIPLLGFAFFSAGCGSTSSLAMFPAASHVIVWPAFLSMRSTRPAGFDLP
jgi:hypothetical protein